MNKFTFNDSAGNLTGKTKRWLGWLAVCGVLLLGQIGFAFLMPNTTNEASNNEVVSTKTQTEQNVQNAQNLQNNALSVANTNEDCSQISESTGVGGGYLFGGDNNQELAGDFLVFQGVAFDLFQPEPSRPCE